MTDVVTEPITVQVSDGTVLRPGDKLIVRLSNTTPPDHLKAFLESLKAALPDVQVVVVAGVEDLIVQRFTPAA